MSEGGGGYNIHSIDEFHFYVFFYSECNGLIINRSY